MCVCHICPIKWGMPFVCVGGATWSFTIWLCCSTWRYTWCNMNLIEREKEGGKFCVCIMFLNYHCLFESNIKLVSQTHIQCVCDWSEIIREIKSGSMVKIHSTLASSKGHLSISNLCVCVTYVVDTTILSLLLVSPGREILDRPNFLVHMIYLVFLWQIWPPGSLEEKVQHLVKTWEMEMFHKVCFDDYKTVDPKKYRFSLNGNPTTTHFTLLNWHSNVFRLYLMWK